MNRFRPLALTLVAMLLAPQAAADELSPLASLDHALTDPASASLDAPAIMVVRPAPPRTARRPLTIVLGGDLGLGAHHARVAATHARRHGTRMKWTRLTSGIAPLIDGDLNFANLETVVTDNNRLRPEAKTFTFRSHPAGVRHLVDIGFNLFSTANNHSMDYGARGARDTLRHLDRMVHAGMLKAHAGLGLNFEQAARVPRISAGGARIAFAAIGIVSGGYGHHRAGRNRPGQLSYRAPRDFARLLTDLHSTPADFRILSVHQGRERSVHPESDAIRKLRRQALLGHDVDLVVTHHAHVARGIEITDGRLLFHGMGNLLHPGMQNMARFGLCQDYGLLARVHLAPEATGHLAVRAVEVIPLTDMHWRARAMKPERARVRIHALNYLARRLDAKATGTRGVRFSPQRDGTGLFCTPEAKTESGRIGRLCRSWTGAPSIPARLKRRVASACGSGLIASRARRGRLTRKGQVHRISAKTRRSRRSWRRRSFAGN